MNCSSEMFSKTSNRFHNQVVVVTGASASVGRAAALAFDREVARVALLARGKEGPESAQQEVELAGGTALTTVVDVSDAETVEAAADAIERVLGPIAVWVNNAMVTIFAPVSEIDANEFKRVTEVAYLGGVYCTMVALKRTRTRDRGVVVQVSSALAYRSISLQSAYCGAKHALLGFLDSLRSELTHDHSAIHVSTLEMPASNTPQFGWALNKLPNLPQPVAPIFQPEVAASAIFGRRKIAVAACRWVRGPGPKSGVRNWFPACSIITWVATATKPVRRTSPTTMRGPTTCSIRSRATLAHPARSGTTP